VNTSRTRASYRYGLLAELAWITLSVACSSDPGGAASSGHVATGGSVTALPGNEAIPDIGQLAKGGASAVAATTTAGFGGASGAATTSLQGSAGGSAGGASGAIGNAGGATSGGAASGGTSAARGGGSGAGGASTANTAEAAYHDLANWVSPQASNQNHHGRVYFMAHAQKDEHTLACTSCHGANLEGTGQAPSCTSCHSNWRGCSYCHGTSPSQYNPPRGVSGETAVATMAVGRHTAHLTASSSHAAFACSACHIVPAANDVTHALSYSPSSDLSTPGHHGDVTFSGLAAGMTWNVNATTGSPASSRGTCLGACHSNGRGGNPTKTPYWAGGAWTSGCTNCHGNPPSSGSHGDHTRYACSECHPGATATAYSSTNHFNGRRDYTSAKMPYSNGQCSGTCHGSESW
jgi:predicted CxxxxCH...CXXCH cytochrome family protein